MVKTIVFDFGNVIGYFDHLLALHRLAPHSEMSPAEMHRAIAGSWIWDAYETGSISTAEFLTHIRSTFRLRCGDDVISLAWSDIFQANVDVCTLIPTLKGRYRLLLGSNTNDLHAAWFRRQFADTLAHFDHLVLSHEIGTRKPRADFFEHCARLAHAEPHECLFIDDMPANIEAARAAGWQAILYTSFADLQEQMQTLGIALTTAAKPKT